MLDTDVVDEIIAVGNDGVLRRGAPSRQEEGLLVASPLARPRRPRCRWPKRPENAGKLIVVVLPSFGERYLSTALFAGLAD